MNRPSKLFFGILTLCFINAIIISCSKEVQQTETNDSQNSRILQDFDELKEYIVSWNIDLNGKEFLLESEFLKSGLEHSIKDILNIELECEEDFDDSLEKTSFYRVRIDDESENKKKISGLGRCKGNRTRCKKKVKKVQSDAGKVHSSLNILEAMNFTNKPPSSCDVSIFDLFQKTLITASSFNYNVTAEVMNDFLGNLDFDLSVSFEEAIGDGLNQIDSVSFDPEEPIEIFTNCDGRCEQQRREQRSILQNIFTYFDIAFDENEHECLFQGLNCNDLDLVTHIWLDNRGTYDLSGKTIPESFFQLPFLEGLFLGGNQLVGSIPTEIGMSNIDLRMLWLQDNALTGQIPTRIGNFRLRELNLYGNKLTGSIPSELGKLNQLRLLNLGRNELVGTIPTELFESGFDERISFDSSCRLFRNPVKKIGLDWLVRTFPPSGDNWLNSLEIFTLHGNNLSGSLPIMLSTLNQLVEISFGENNFVGGLPSQIGSMRQLQILDIHENNLSGLIPDEIGHLRYMRVLNFYNNRFEKKIPTTIGMLTQLRELILDSNELTGPIPSEIGNLMKLNHLSFSDNKMSGIIPTEIGELVSLINLDMRDYSIIGNQNGKTVSGGTLPTELGRLRNWKYVVFRNNGIEGTLPSELGRLESAEAFWLENEEISGTLPFMGRFKSLSLLYLRNNSLEGTIPESIGFLRNLETFDIGMNRLSGSIPDEIADVSPLNHVFVGNNKLQGSLPTSLGDLSSLKYLNVESNLITAEIPPELGKLNNLKAFDIAKNNVTGTIPPELGNLSGLVLLDIEHNTLSGRIPSELGKLELLQSIDLSDNQLGSSIPSEFGLIDDMVSIDFSNNLMTGSVPTEIGNLEDLNSFNISGNNITRQRFMCRLQSLEVEESVDLNCSNYCGTIDEECNATSIADAKCEDVGCSGDGVPQCTNLCRLDYSSCVAGENEMIFKLELETVNNGWETQWEIRNELGPLWQNERVYRNHDSFTTELRCLPRNCYSFELYDLGNDGICCGENENEFGNFSVSVDDNMIGESNPNFGSSIVFEIGSCVIGPSFQNTLYPTMTPTKFKSKKDLTTNPSQAPTNNPSNDLSLSPSEPLSQFPSTSPLISPSTSQSISPSASPSIPPSTSPSISPSISPSTSPSTSPSISPSVSPSMSPTISPSIIPSSIPSVGPSERPSKIPSLEPSQTPSHFSSLSPSSSKTPTAFPTEKTSLIPTSSPSSSSMPSTLSPSKLTAPDGESGDNFGSDVAISDRYIVVSAYKDSDNGVNSGSAYLFRRNGNYITKLTAFDGTAMDHFARRIALSEDRIVIGSYSDDNGSESGSVYIFNSNGSFITKITAFDGESGDKFGSSVDVSSDTIVVGAYGDHDFRGAAYFYDKDGNYVTKVTAFDGEDYDKFGFSIAVFNETVVVGAPDDQDHGSDSGSVYIYTTSGGYIDKITAHDGTASDKFGTGLDISGDVIVVGSHWDDDNGSKSGSAYIYSIDGSFIKKIDPPDGAKNDMFGRSVAVSGNTIIVGSYLDDDNGSSSGSVYVYDTNGNYDQKIIAPNGNVNDYFGWSVAVSGDTIVVGSNGHNDAGSAYICISNICSD